MIPPYQISGILTPIGSPRQPQTIYEPLLPPPTPRTDIAYRLLTSSELDSAVDLIAEVFSRDEPLAVATGQTRSELAALLRGMGPSAVAEEKTYAAWVDDRMAGIALATAFTWMPPDGVESLSPNYRPIGAMLAELESTFEARPRQDLADTLHIHMLAVHSDHRGHGIAEGLVSACVGNAAKHGFRRVVTDATNPSSQRVFERAGFSALNEIRYDSFEFEGQRVFAKIPNASSILFMGRDIPTN
jgi:ribosomal protein S18 acetylase RimI-like enzyme